MLGRRGWMVRDRRKKPIPEDSGQRAIAVLLKGHLCAKEGRQLSEMRSVIENSTASPITGSRSSLTHRLSAHASVNVNWPLCIGSHRVLFSILALVVDGQCDSSHALPSSDVSIIAFKLKSQFEMVSRSRVASEIAFGVLVCTIQACPKYKSGVLRFERFEEGLVSVCCHCVCCRGFRKCLGSG